ASIPQATACAPFGLTIRQYRGSGASPVTSCKRWLSSRSGVTARSTTSAAVSMSIATSDPPLDERLLPRVDDARLRLPHLSVGSARKHGERAPLGAHRHPVVGLGEDGGLARDRVPQHGEAVRGADE